METKHSVLYLYAETPLHAGTGAGLGAVDLPIQREKHTNFPIIQASGVKGALRDTAEINLNNDELIQRIFGGASGSDGETHAGAISPSDARILCFPVRALSGVFVWVTSPTVLSRYQRETQLTGLPELSDISDPLVSSNACLVGRDQLILEEFTYTASVSDSAQHWANHLAARLFPEGSYWHQRLQSYFVILPDNEFRDFARYSTEIVTRIHIDDEKKIVKDGQLFTQELLPADSLLYSVLRVTDSRSEQTMNADTVLETVANAIGQRIQIGADETVGRGRMYMSWAEVD